MAFTPGVKNKYVQAVLKLMLAIGMLPVLSGAAPAGDEDLTGLSIEELMTLEVTSVGKKKQQLSDSAAAIFVITNEDLRRSGAISLPDALRMVPGVNVSRIDSNKWAVSARGFNTRFSSKLLILIDGRSIYTPTFSGVYWEVNDLMPADVERIEVIRGPGATLWGANAVNGVINIITKHTKDTQGGVVSAGGGSHEKTVASARYGGAMGDNTHWRAWAKYQNRDSFSYPDGQDAGDGWDMGRFGFRMDTRPTASDAVMLQGNIYDGGINQTLFLAQPADPYLLETKLGTSVSGTSLIARWQRSLSPDSELVCQVYYDGSERTEDVVNEERDNVDMEIQHRFAAGSRHDIVWGGRYRYMADDYDNSSISDIDPLSRRDNLFSAFVQDEITILSKKLWLTLGSKFEHNNYSGTEVQPSARLLWSAADTHRLWWAVSKAVRTPSRMETDGKFTYSAVETNFFSLTALLNLAGSKNFDSEELTAYEFGYRFIPEKAYSVDLAFFYNDYDNLRTFETSELQYNGVYLETDLILVNKIAGETYGGELAFSWAVTDYFKTDLAYAFLAYDFDNELFGGCPRHQVSLRNRFNLGPRLELDVWLRYVDDVSANYVFDKTRRYEIDGYLTMDLRMGWHVTPNIEIALVGQNLLDDGHVEFVQEAFTRVTEIEHSVFGQVSIRF